jgi:phosphoglycolate phosphatase
METIDHPSSISETKIEPPTFTLPIKAILFDHDDTLVSTIKAKWAQHKFIAKTFYGKDLQDDEIRVHWGKPFSVLIKLLYNTDDADSAVSYNLHVRKDFPKTLFEDTIETLTILRNKEMKIGLVTATTLSNLENDFTTLNISKHLFDYIQTEEDTIYHKPDSRVFEPALKWLAQKHIYPHEVLYVGDSLNDMKAALGAGFQFLGVHTGLTSIEEFRQNQVNGIQRLREVTEILTP